MIPRRRLALAILLGAIVVALALSLSGPGEPSYQGRPLSAWTEDLMGNPSETRGRAVQAIEHMGSNAVPHLVRMMQRRDSRLRVKLADWINSHSPIKDPFVPASRRQEQALAACWILGPAAAAAVPAITDLLSIDGVAPSAARALTAVAGAQAVLPLSQALTNQSVRVRSSAAHALASLGGSALPAVPALRARLMDPDPTVRLDAAGALLGITGDPSVRVEALLVYLKDANPSIRLSGVQTLGLLKEGARSAVPKLKALLQDPDPAVASAVAMALRQIDPQPVPADPAAPDPSRLHGPGPMVQDRPLAHWLRDLSARSTDETVDLSPQRRRAEEAITQAGTNAVPLLLSMLDCAGAEKSHLNCRVWGRNGFQALGPAGKTVIPSLLALLNDQVVRSTSPVRYAALALADIGPEALAPLLEALRNGDDGVRAGAAAALGELGQSYDASAAVPALLRSLNDPDQLVIRMAARALGQIGEEPVAAVRALADGIESIGFITPRTTTHRIGRAELHREYAGALYRFGAQAKGAVPTFLKAIQARDGPLFQLAPLALAGVEDTELAKVIEALTTLLVSSKHLTAAQTLGGFGARARAAVPALQGLALTWTGPKADPHAVALTLKHIDPAAARGLIPELIARLRHGEPARRLQAARVLGAYRPEARSTEAALKLALQDRDPAVRAAAATSLKQTLSTTSQTPRGFDAFGVPVVISDDPINAGLLLQQLKSDSTVTVRSAISKVSLAAGKTINGFGPDTPAIVAALTGNLQHTNAQIAMLASSALLRLGPDARPAAPALLRSLQEHSSLRKFQVLRNLAPEMAASVVPLLLTRLADSNPETRMTNARLLAEAGEAAHAQVVALLAQALRDGQREVLLGVLEVFQQNERLDRSGVSHSLVLAGTPQFHFIKRIDVRDPAIHAGLVRLLANADTELRRGAVRVLGLLGGRTASALPALREVAGRDPDWKVRGYAARAIRQIERDLKSGSEAAR